MPRPRPRTWQDCRPSRPRYVVRSPVSFLVFPLLSNRWMESKATGSERKENTSHNATTVSTIHLHSYLQKINELCAPGFVKLQADISRNLIRRRFHTFVSYKVKPRELCRIWKNQVGLWIRIPRQGYLECVYILEEVPEKFPFGLGCRISRGDDGYRGRTLRRSDGMAASPKLGLGKERGSWR